MSTLPPAVAVRLLASLPRIRRSLIRLGIEPHRAEDVAAVVVLAVVESWSMYDPALGSPDAWIAGIVANLASHERERAHVRREVLAGLNPAADTPAAAVNLDARAELAAVRRAFGRLQAIEQEVLAAVVAGEVPRELAERFNQPASTLYKVLYRARSKLDRARRGRGKRDSR